MIVKLRLTALGAIGYRSRGMLWWLGTQGVVSRLVVVVAVYNATIAELN